MEPPSDSSVELQRQLTKASAWMGWAIALTGALALLGWLTGNVFLRTWYLNPITIKANTALAFVVVGAALLLLLPVTLRAWRRWTGQALALVVVVLSVITLLEYVLGRDLGVDSLLIREVAGPLAGSHPGRPSLPASLGFLFAGGALLSLHWKTRYTSLLNTTLATLTGLIGTLGILDTLIAPQSSDTGMASPTAVSFFLLGLALLLARPGQGLMAPVVAGGSSGAMARLLMLPAVALPLLLTWLGWLGQQHGWYDPVLASVLVAAAHVAVFCGLILGAAALSGAIEAEKSKADQRLHKANRALRALSLANEALVRAENEEKLLADVCRIAVEAGGYRLAWVGIPVNDATLSVRPAASAGEACGYVASIEVSWGDNERGRGPTGSALRSSRIQIARDVETEASFGPWREAARQHGLAASIVLPLLDRDEVLGALNIYSGEVDAFDAAEVELLSKLASDLAYGMAALRAGREREQEAAARRRSEERYRSLVVATSQIVWSTGPSGLVEPPFRDWQNFTGQSDDEVRGEGWARALHPEDSERTKQLWRQALEARSLFDSEYRLRRRDGEYRQMRARGVPVLDEDGSIREWIGTCTDITEQRELEEGLREAQAYNRGLIESSIDGMVTVDEAGRVTDVNQMICRMAGKTREEVIGSQFTGYFTDPSRAEQGVRQTFEHGAVADYVLTLRAAGGREIPVSFNASVFRDAAGEVQGIFAAARDITERQRAEEALREAQAYNRGLIESSIDGMVTVDEAGRVTDINEMMCRMAGKTREEVIGSQFTGYFTDPSRAEQGVRQTFEHGAVADYVLTLRAAGGREIPVSFNASVFRDAAGEVQGIFAAARDITERQRAEEALTRSAAELKRSNQELEDFATVASHDLQEPLRKITVFGERLVEHCSAGLDERGRDYLARMENAARRMSGLINGLLDYSRVNRKGREFQPTDLNQVVAEVLADLESQIEQAGAEVAVENLPVVSADALQMRQLLQNLISNALKFQRPEALARVAVRGVPARGGWEIHVSDNGIGFEERYLDRIFKPFQKLHSRNEYEGHGMGLAVCDKIVHRHGWQIAAHSRPGEGSDFIVTIPAGQQKPREETVWTAKASSENGGKSSSSWPKTMTTISS